MTDIDEDRVLTYLKLTTVSELTCWVAKSAQRAARRRKASFIFFLYKLQLLCGTNKKEREDKQLRLL
jgi:hypothetical protein